MKLKEFKKAVFLTIGRSTEDMDPEEINTLKDKIVLAANMGMDAIVREAYPLEKSITINGKQEYNLSGLENYLKLVCYCGGRAEKYIDENGNEVLRLLDEAEYRVTYNYLPEFIENRESDYTFVFPRQVLQALIYYCCYHILSPVNDKREYAYFKNQYDQQCVNIAANRPVRATIIGGGRHGI